MDNLKTLVVRYRFRKKFQFVFPEFLGLETKQGQILPWPVKLGLSYYKDRQ
jgi:hypothetical protein